MQSRKRPQLEHIYYRSSIYTLKPQLSRQGWIHKYINSIDSHLRNHNKGTEIIKKWVKTFTTNDVEIAM